MSSIIEGYNYDIFISYRQKDNKYDGWVTEFVDNLKKELEATFKEEISVYFDINPHDGLLETHDVGESLKEKLKCLVFIPIISRTFCDPKSFAWVHEFKAFIDQASEDKYRLKVKLPGGNVASRVLPVQIHELDPEDKKLVEYELGGFLRGIEFIYREPGVNRPLRANEDHPDNNLNKTFYRNQINKVANSIKDIITSLGSYNQLSEVAATKGNTESGVKPNGKSLPGRDKINVWDVKHNLVRKSRYLRITSVSFIVIILSVISIVLFTGGSDINFNERDWIIITDFDNQTGDSIFDNSLNTAFMLSISQSRYINVMSRQRMNETLKRMKSNVRNINEETGREIAVREGIRICIVPGISRVGSQYILTAKIIDATNGYVFRSEVIYVANQDEILPNLDKLTQWIRKILGESRFEISGSSKPLSGVTTRSLEALKEYSTARDYLINSDFGNSILHFENALRIDTGFIAAKATLGNLNCERYDRQKGIKMMKEVINRLDDLADWERYAILSFYAINVDSNLNKGISYTKELSKLYPDDPTSHHNLGWLYQNQKLWEDAVKEYKMAIIKDPHFTISYTSLIWIYVEKLGNMDSALLWSKKMELDSPEHMLCYFYQGSAYAGKEQFDKAEEEFTKTAALAPDLLVNQYRLAQVCRIQGKYDKAIEILTGVLKTHPEESSCFYDLGVNFGLKGNTKLSQEYFLQYYKRKVQERLKSPENPALKTSVAITLARMGRKQEGMELFREAIATDTTLYINYASFYANMGMNKEAIAQLEKALNNGYRSLPWLRIGPDLNLLANDEDFIRLINQYFKY